MRDELARRRPGFQRGLDLRLADNQIWSLPEPSPAGTDPGAESSATAPWDDSDYRAILQAIAHADDAGEHFRAEVALAIHLLRWNYEVDGADLEELLDDRGDEPTGHLLGEALDRLAAVHLGFPDPRGVGEPDPGADSWKDWFLRRLGKPGSWLPRDRRFGGSADATG